MFAVRTLYARCVRAVNTLQQLLARRRNAMDAIKTLWESCGDAVRTLRTRYDWQIWYFYTYFAATPQHADRFSERCTNAMASPFGITEA